MALGDIVDAFSWELLVLSYAYTFFFALLPQRWTMKFAKAYKTLKFKWLKPPRALYIIAWGILYPLIAYAAFAVRSAGGPWTSANVTGLVLYAILQPVLALYSPFAAWKWYWTTFLVILIALGLAIATAIFFASVDVLACIFLSALAVWLVVAAILQFDVARSNSDALFQSVRNFSNGRSKTSKI